MALELTIFGKTITVHSLSCDPDETRYDSHVNTVDLEARVVQEDMEWADAQSGTTRVMVRDDRFIFEGVGFVAYAFDGKVGIEVDNWRWRLD